MVLLIEIIPVTRLLADDTQSEGLRPCEVFLFVGLQY
jgi:hypothetical protein